MAEENATSTYSMAEPYDQAIELLRRAISAANLTITGEFDVSERIHKALMLCIAPCRVLFAHPSSGDAEGMSAEPESAVFTPLHIVVSARGRHTQVHILRVLPRQQAAVGDVQLARLSRMETAVSQAIEKIAMRASMAL